jgi:peptidylprolyl isomerase
MVKAGGILKLCISIVALCAIVAAAGCGGDNSPEASAKDSGEVGIPSSPPEIKLPAGLPPKKLVIRDMEEGTGTEAKKGDSVQIQYFGVNWKEGTEHANSWRYEHIPVFDLSEHRLLRGLTITIPGMKEGGSREVIIPSNLVFYPGTPHPHLSPLEALIYKVYLVKVFKNH